MAIARRKGERWWVGAPTSWQPRTLDLALSFLGDGDYAMVACRDGVNADRYAQNHVRETAVVRSSDRLERMLAPGGGWVARFEPGG